MLDRGRGDERVGKADAGVPTYPSRTLGNSPVDGHLSQRAEQGGDDVGRRCAGEQLGASDHRVMQPMPARSEFDGPTQMVDEDIGIDEDVSHDPTRRGTARLATGRHRR